MKHDVMCPAHAVELSDSLIAWAPDCQCSLIATVKKLQRITNDYTVDVAYENGKRDGRLEVRDAVMQALGFSVPHRGTP